MTDLLLLLVFMALYSALAMGLTGDARVAVIVLIIFPLGWWTAGKAFGRWFR
jgi:hypothetical protein